MYNSDKRMTYKNDSSSTDERMTYKNDSKSTDKRENHVRLYPGYRNIIRVKNYKRSSDKISSNKDKECNANCYENINSDEKNEKEEVKIREDSEIFFLFSSDEDGNEPLVNEEINQIETDVLKSKLGSEKHNESVTNRSKFPDSTDKDMPNSKETNETSQIIDIENTNNGHFQLNKYANKEADINGLEIDKHNIVNVRNKLVELISRSTTDEMNDEEDAIIDEKLPNLDEMNIQFDKQVEGEKKLEKSDQAKTNAPEIINELSQLVEKVTDINQIDIDLTTKKEYRNQEVKTRNGPSQINVEIQPNISEKTKVEAIKENSIHTEIHRIDPKLVESTILGDIRRDALYGIKQTDKTSDKIKIRGLVKMDLVKLKAEISSNEDGNEVQNKFDIHDNNSSDQMMEKNERNKKDDNKLSTIEINHKHIIRQNPMVNNTIEKTKSEVESRVEIDTEEQSSVSTVDENKKTKIVNIAEYESFEKSLETNFLPEVTSDSESQEIYLEAPPPRKLYTSFTDSQGIHEEMDQDSFHSGRKLPHKTNSRFGQMFQSRNQNSIYNKPNKLKRFVYDGQFFDTEKSTDFKNQIKKTYDTVSHPFSYDNSNQIDEVRLQDYSDSDSNEHNSFKKMIDNSIENTIYDNDNSFSETSHADQDANIYVVENGIGVNVFKVLGNEIDKSFMTSNFELTGDSSSHEDFSDESSRENVITLRNLEQFPREDFDSREDSDEIFLPRSNIAFSSSSLEDDSDEIFLPLVRTAVAPRVAPRPVYGAPRPTGYGYRASQCNPETKYSVVTHQIFVPTVKRITATQYLPKTVYSSIVQTKYYGPSEIEVVTITKIDDPDVVTKTKVLYKNELFFYLMDS